MTTLGAPPAAVEQIWAVSHEREGLNAQKLVGYRLKIAEKSPQADVDSVPLLV